jgi:hypothetical protein
VTVGRKVRTSAPADAATVPTLWKWCPLHEISHHDLTTWHHLNGLVGSPRSTSRSVLPRGLPVAATSVTSAATGHATAPARPPTRVGLAAGERASWEPGLGAVPTVAIREGLPGDEVTTLPR